LLILSVALTITVGFLLVDRVNNAIWDWKEIEDICLTKVQPDGTSALVCLREPYVDLRLAPVIGIGLAVGFWLVYPPVCRRLSFVQDDR
jgi:hypothetical protein